MIKTIKELKRAFAKQLVDEVSPNLILNSPENLSKHSSLYPINMGEAWVHSSAGLYNLLNVNARNTVKKNNKEAYNARKKNNILDLHPLTIYAAQRGVGFDFGFTKKQAANSDSYPPLPNAATPTPWVAFDITDGSFETLSGLSTQTPVEKNFKKFTFKKTIQTQECTQHTKRKITEKRSHKNKTIKNTQHISHNFKTHNNSSSSPLKIHLLVSYFSQHPFFYLISVWL